MPHLSSCSFVFPHPPVSVPFREHSTLTPNASHAPPHCATQELMKFDYEDDSNWKDIVNGVDVVFSSSPDNVIEG